MIFFDMYDLEATAAGAQWSGLQRPQSVATISDIP
jgi:hypothetical protein